MPTAYFDEDIGLGELREDDLDALYRNIERYYLEAAEWRTKLQMLIQSR